MRDARISAGDDLRSWLDGRMDEVTEPRGAKNDQGVGASPTVLMEKSNTHAVGYLI